MPAIGAARVLQRNPDMTASPSVVKATRFGLTGLFISAGIFHFVIPRFFVAIVPHWIPHPDLMVAVSGVAEMAGGLGLVLPATRRMAGWGLLLLLVAVFPANIQMLLDSYQPGHSIVEHLILWARLPLQPVLMWLVWQVMGSSEQA